MSLAPQPALMMTFSPANILSCTFHPNSLMADTVCGNYTDISSANTPTAC